MRVVQQSIISCYVIRRFDPEETEMNHEFSSHEDQRLSTRSATVTPRQMILTPHSLQYLTPIDAEDSLSAALSCCKCAFNPIRRLSNLDTSCELSNDFGDPKPILFPATLTRGFIEGRLPTSPALSEAGRFRTWSGRNPRQSDYCL